MAGIPQLVTPVTASAESPLRSLYHQWQAAKQAFNTSGLDQKDPQESKLFNAILDCEDEAAALTPQSIEDYAFKIIFADDDGDMSMNVAQRALVAQAYALVGITPRFPAGVAD